MYESHWGLSESPFRGGIDTRFFFESPTHAEALARMHFMVENRRKLAVITGRAGSGKSLLLEVAARDLRRAGRDVAQLSLVGVNSEEFLAQLCESLHLNPTATDSVSDLWRMVVDRVRSNRCRMVGLVIMIDDLQFASPEVVQSILRLLAVDSSPESPVSILLACEKEWLHRVDKSLLERTQLKIEIEPWDESETADFLNHVLHEAGSGGTVFSQHAALQLHDLTGGNPRAIAQLAELSLVAGMGQSLKQIDERIVNEVYHELSVHVNAS